MEWSCTSDSPPNLFLIRKYLIWVSRATESDFARHALEHGLADDVLLEEISEAWQEWGEQPDAWFAMLHGELLARVR